MRFGGPAAMILAGLAWTGSARADEAAAHPAVAGATGSEAPPSNPTEGAPYDGGALPPGFHAERRRSVAPMVIGGTIFLASWVGFALAASVPSPHDPGWYFTWIPVNGALTFGATTRPNDDFPRSVILSICAFDTAGQLLGLSIFAWGAFFGPQVIARDAPPVAIAPYVTPREVGVAGRF